MILLGQYLWWKVEAVSRSRSQSGSRTAKCETQSGSVKLEVEVKVEFRDGIPYVGLDLTSLIDI